MRLLLLGIVLANLSACTTTRQGYFCDTVDGAVFCASRTVTECGVNLEQCDSGRSYYCVMDLACLE
jgi:hypothetical protein